MNNTELTFKCTANVVDEKDAYRYANSYVLPLGAWETVTGQISVSGGLIARAGVEPSQKLHDTSGGTASGY